MTITDTSSIDSESDEFNTQTLTFKAWQDQYQFIHHLILYSNILMIVQGRKSSGKTTYAKGLADKLPHEFSCQTVQASQIENKDALDLCLRQLFSLNSPNTQEDKSNVSLVEQVCQARKHCLLIVDDAHLLNDDLIATLLTYLNSQNNDSYFHCLLIGDPMLTLKFSQAPLESCGDAFTHIIDLPELDLPDVKGFLNRKFSSLGTEQMSSMTDDYLRSLLKKSDGNLCVLSELAQDKLRGIVKSISSESTNSFIHKYIYTYCICR